MILQIMVDGRVRSAAPYRPENMRETARALDEQLPTLRQIGRVAVFVTDDTGVAHIIVTS